VNGRPSPIVKLMMSKYRSVAPSSVMSLATLPLYSTLPRSSEYHAVTTGRVRLLVTAFASANLMRGRRRHDRHTESWTSKFTFGERRRWNVFTPTSVPANFSVMLRCIPLTTEHVTLGDGAPHDTALR